MADIGGDAYMQASDAYKYTWEDVDPVEQEKAVKRAIADYDSTNSWDRSTDCPRSSIPRGHVVLDGRWVRKAKIYSGRLCGRARWTPRGFRDRLAEKGDCTSPTASRNTHRACSVLGVQAGMISFSADFSEAFFHSELIPDSDTPVWIEDPEQKGTFRRLKRYVPGTKQAPQSWYKTLAVHLVRHGAVQSKVDPCLFYLTDRTGKYKPRASRGEPKWIGYLAIHVDDVKGRVYPQYRHIIETILPVVGANKTPSSGVTCAVSEIVWPELGEPLEFCGERETESEDGLRWDQQPYIENKLEPIDLPLDRWRKPPNTEATDEELSKFRTSFGQGSWVTHGCRPDRLFETSYAASRVHQLQIGHLIRWQKAVKHLVHPRTAFEWHAPKLPAGKLKIVYISDAGEGENRDGGLDWQTAQAGYSVGFQTDGAPATSGPYACIMVRSHKCRRVTGNSFDGECVAAIHATDNAVPVRMLYDEWLNGVRPGILEKHEQRLAGASAPKREEVQMELHVDNKGLVQAVENLGKTGGMSVRRRGDVADLQQLRTDGDLKRVIYINGEYNPLDAVTKAPNRKGVKETMDRLVTMLTTGWYDVISDVPTRAQRSKLLRAERGGSM